MSSRMVVIWKPTKSGKLTATQILTEERGPMTRKVIPDNDVIHNEQVRMAALKRAEKHMPRAKEKRTVM